MSETTYGRFKIFNGTPSGAAGRALNDNFEAAEDALTILESDVGDLDTNKINSVSEDTSPELGGDLNVSTYSIVSTTSNDIAITPDGTGSVVLDGLKWPSADGTDGQVLKTDGSGNLGWVGDAVGLSSIVEDTAPQLGGDLDLNDHNVAGRTEAQLQAAADSAHTQGSDTILDEGGTNQVTAEQALAAYDHSIVNTGNPHSVTQTEVGLSNVTNDAQVTKSTITTKGDLIIGDLAGEPARLGVGTNNHVLIADSTQTNGLKWGAAATTPPGGDNTQVQYNNSGAFAGDSGFTWTTGTNALLSATSHLVVGGTYNAGYTIPNATGERMFFNPRKAAFRAGSTSSTQWNDVNVGAYSFAAGRGTTASASYSTAFGFSTNASGYLSTAFGYSTTASGDYSTAFGRNTTASSYYSTAFGYSTTASGYYFTAFGGYTTASSYYSTAFGYYSEARDAGQITQANYAFGGTNNANRELASCQRSDISYGGEYDNTDDLYISRDEWPQYLQRHSIPAGTTTMLNVNALAVQNETFNMVGWKLVVVVQNNGTVTEIVKIKENYAGTSYVADDEISPNVTDDEFFDDVKLSFATIDGYLTVKAHNTTTDPESIRWHIDLHGTEIKNTPQSAYS